MHQFDEEVLRDLAAIMKALAQPDLDQSIIAVERLLTHLTIKLARTSEVLPKKFSEEIWERRLRELGATTTRSGAA